MKPQDKQAYLEEYELLKKKGKPFFPYAVMKDSTMALIVVAVIIAMSLILGAEQGPKADPTSTTYVPRPEWYFFFLFEVLRVIKPPSWSRSRRSASRRSAWCSCSCCRSTTAGPSATRSAARSPPPPAA